MTLARLGCRSSKRQSLDDSQLVTTTLLPFAHTCVLHTTTRRLQVHQTRSHELCTGQSTTLSPRVHGLFHSAAPIPVPTPGLSQLRIHSWSCQPFGVSTRLYIPSLRGPYYTCRPINILGCQVAAVRWLRTRRLCRESCRSGIYSYAVHAVQSSFYITHGAS